MAIPVGTQVLGRVASIEPLSHKRRALAIANGDFTPLRKAPVDFDMLVLKDGTRLPLHTSVSEGVPNVVHLTAGGTGKKNDPSHGRALGGQRDEGRAGSTGTGSFASRATSIPSLSSSP